MKIKQCLWFKCVACIIVMSVFMLVTETPVRAEQNMNSYKMATLLQAYWRLAPDSDEARSIWALIQNLFFAGVPEATKLIDQGYNPEEQSGRLKAHAETEPTVKAYSDLEQNLQNLFGAMNATITIEEAPSMDGSGSGILSFPRYDEFIIFLLIVSLIIWAIIRSDD